MNGLRTAAAHFRFTPKSRRQSDIGQCPLCADFVAEVRCLLLRTVISFLGHNSLRRQTMMGRLKHEQAQLFYEFQLDEVVPDDHLVRECHKCTSSGGHSRPLTPSRKPKRRSARP